MAEERSNIGTDCGKTQNAKCEKVNQIIKCFLIALLFVAIVLCGVFYFNIYRPKGGDSAGPPVPDEPFKHIWTEKKVLLLGIGDDITDGSSVKEGFSYFQRLVKNPRGDAADMYGKNLTRVFPNITATNTASSWSTSFNHLEGLTMAQVYPQDVTGIVVLTTGFNEIVHNYGEEPPKERGMYGATMEQVSQWLDNFQNRLDEMIKFIGYIFPGGSHIFVANIYDPTDGMGFTDNWFKKAPAWPDGLAILEAYNQIIENCGKKYDNVHIVDIHGAFLGHGIKPQNVGTDEKVCWYNTKSADPTADERGHDVIRRLFLNEMLKVFYRTQSSRQ